MRLAGLNDNVAFRILEMFPGPRTLFTMQTIASRIDSRLYVQKQFSNQRRFNNENQKSNIAHPQQRKMSQNYKLELKLFKFIFIKYEIK